MDNHVQIPTTYVMRDFDSSPAARALRAAVRLSIRAFCLGATLFLAIPSYGPTIPVRTIPNYTRIASLATLVSGPVPDRGFTQYVAWVAPPRFNWDFFAGLDDFAVFDLGLSEPDTQVIQAVSSFDTSSIPDTVAAAFFTPDSFGASDLDFTVPTGSFVLAARPNLIMGPEPGTSFLIAIGMAGLALATLYRRKRSRSRI
jgi:PEP-CTERM motif